jgi:hypothetical protein
MTCPDPVVLTLLGIPISVIRQVGLGLFGVPAVLLAMDPAWSRRRWAPIFGLAGQPFWFWSAISAEQWGIVLLSVLYTLSYIRGLRTYWTPGAVDPATRAARPARPEATPADN